MGTATIYLGLGANLGDREANIRRAVELLGSRGITVIRLSPLYETEPWGIVEQPRFLNAACSVETDIGPDVLLDLLKAIEAQLGRVSIIHWGPRTIDLDILLYGDVAISEPDLQVPHPQMLKRQFVLVPLAEIAPGVLLPDGRRAAEAAAGGPDVRLYGLGR